MVAQAWDVELALLLLRRSQGIPNVYRSALAVAVCEGASLVLPVLVISIGRSSLQYWGLFHLRFYSAYWASFFSSGAFELQQWLAG